MPTITLSKKDLLSQTKKLSDDDLKNRISMLGTDLEGIEGDDILVEIFPNRPDLLSQQGFNRAFSSFIGKKVGLYVPQVKKGTTKVIIEKSTQDVRPYTACAVVRNLHITKERLDEIITVQEKLHVTFGRNRKRVAIGIYPLEKITAPITFVGLSKKDIRFTPLDATKDMSASEILEKHPKGKEYAHLVKDLDTIACFVDAKKNIMSLTPIINSEHVGKVTTQTTEVFVECSGFDFRILEEALAMIVYALSDMGGTIESCTLEYKHSKLGVLETPRLEPQKMPLDKTYINNMLGLALSEKEMIDCLERMGFGWESDKKKSQTNILIPAYRADILHQADLAEDIAIAYGYENFKPKIPQTSTVGEISPKTHVTRVMRSILTGHGLLEMKNYHLLGEETNNIITDKKDTEHNKLANSISSEFNTLRNEVITSVLGALSRNKHHEYPQRVFEIGTCFQNNEQKEGSKKAQEKTQLAIALAGEKEDYTAIRQVIDSLFLAYNIQGEISFQKTQVSWLLQGRSAQIMHDKQVIGVLGEVNPEVLSQLHIEMPMSAATLFLEAFVSKKQ